MSPGRVLHWRAERVSRWRAEKNPDSTYLNKFRWNKFISDKKAKETEYLISIYILQPIFLAIIAH